MQAPNPGPNSPPIRDPYYGTILRRRPELFSSDAVCSELYDFKRRKNMRITSTTISGRVKLNLWEKDGIAVASVSAVWRIAANINGLPLLCRP